MGKIFSAIGLMSGTSMDGIDVAFIRTDGEQFVENGPTAEYAYDDNMRYRIAHALEEAKFLTHCQERTIALGALERDITKLHGEAVLGFLSDNELEASDIDFVGFHGQTLVHRPQEGLSVQIGDGALLSEICDIATVYDLRQNDLANGGQGAPLVPVFHQALGENMATSSTIELPVAFVNIGGIANVTYVDKGQDPIAFDCGPGNNLIDQWMAARGGVAMDMNGEVGCRGRVDEGIVDAYMSLPFFSKRPPKSLDRSDFPPLDDEALGLEDGAATLAALTARAIFASADYFPKKPKRWIISGGGAHNKAILTELARLSGEQGAVSKADDVGLKSDSLEAQAWAYLAVRGALGRLLTFPTTTGVREAVSGGEIVRISGKS